MATTKGNQIYSAFKDATVTETLDGNMSSIVTTRRKYTLHPDAVKKALGEYNERSNEDVKAYETITCTWTLKFKLKFEDWLSRWMYKKRDCIGILKQQPFGFWFRRCPSVVLHHAENWNKNWTKRELVKAEAQGALGDAIGSAIDAAGGLVTGSIKQLFGLQDKPLTDKLSIPVINRTCGVLAHGVGEDPSIQLSLTPTSATQVLPSQIGTSTADFTLKTLCQIPTIVETVDWKDSDDVGKLLFQAPVCPTYIPNSRTALNNTNNYVTYSPTMLAYVARTCGLWRGSMEWRIEVVKSDYHRGRLLIQYDPHGCSSVALPVMKDNFNHNIVIMDLQEKSELTVVTPFMAPRPWLRCNHFVGQDSITSAKTEPTSGVANKLYLNQTHSGLFKIFILNDLVRPDNVANNVQINVYVRAGDDFELAIPVPLEPLSVTIPPGTAYQTVMYPVCEKSEKLYKCNSKYYIDQLWLEGRLLFKANRLKIAATNKWFQATIANDAYPDAVQWYYQAHYIDVYVRAHSTNECSKYALSLPTYGNKTDSENSAVEQIGTNVTNLVESTNTIQSNVKYLVAQAHDNKVQIGITQKHTLDAEKVTKSNNKLLEEMKETNETINETTQLLNTKADLNSFVQSKIEQNLKEQASILDHLSEDNDDINQRLANVHDSVETISEDVHKSQRQLTEIRASVSHIYDRSDEVNSAVSQLQQETQDIRHTIGTNPEEGLQRSIKYIEDHVHNCDECVNGVAQGGTEEESTERSQNITFIDEQVVDKTQLHLHGSKSLPDQTGAITDVPWHIHEVLTREYPVATISWTVSQDVGTDIYREGIPACLIKNGNALSVQQLQMFAFARYGVRLRFQLNGTPFHQGMLVGRVVPLSWADDDDKTKYNKLSMTCWPSVKLNASVSNSGVIDVPFVHLMSYFSQEKGTLQDGSMNALGQIVLQPLNKLQAGDNASQTLYGTIYASLLTPEVHQPVQRVTFDYGDGYIQGGGDSFDVNYEHYCVWLEDKIVSLELDRYRIYSTTNTRDINVVKTACIGIRAYIDNPTSKNERKAYNAMNQALRYLEVDADTTHCMEINFEGTVKEAFQTFALLGDTVGQRIPFKWGEVWLFTRLWSIVRHLTQAHAQGDIQETSVREDDGSKVVLTHGMKTTSPAPVTIAENAMNIQTLLRRYYPVVMSGMSNGVTGYTLYCIPVTPFAIPEHGDSEFAFNNGGSLAGKSGQPTILSWMSYLFTYWRGSVRMKITFNDKRSHVVVWHDPFAADAFARFDAISPETIASQLNYAGVTAVTETQSSIEVSIPYKSAYENLLIDIHHTHNDLRAQNGCLYVAISNTERYSRHNLFISTGEDFMLHTIKAPPNVYEPYVAATSKDDLAYAKRMGEFSRPIGDGGRNFALPGLSNFERLETSFGKCSKPTAAAGPEICKTCVSDFRHEQLEPKNEQMQAQGLVDINMQVPEALQSSIVYTLQNTIADGMQAATTNILKSDVSREVHELGALTRQLAEQTAEVVQRIGIMSDSITQTVPELRSAISKVDKLADDTNDRGVALTQAVSRACGSLDSVGVQGSILASGLHTYINMAVTGGAILSMVELFKNFSFTQMVSTISLVGTSLSINQELIQQTVATVWSYYRTEANRAEANDGPVPQSIDQWVFEHQENLTIGLAALCTTIYVGMFGKMPRFGELVKRVRKWFESTLPEACEQGMDTFAHWLRDIHFSTMGFKAINAVYKKFEEFITMTINWWCGIESESARADRIISERRDEIVDWLKEIEKLNDAEVLISALSDPFYHNKYYALMDRSREFTEWAVKTEGVPAQLVSIIREGRNQCQTLVTRLNEVRPQHGFRYCPFVVMLDGDSGVGKSRMIPEIRNVLRKNLNAPYYNLMYSFPSGDEFLSGYEQQTIVEWDDMLQSTEQDVLIPQWIQWVSNADVRLNMPDLPHKGQFFTSKAFICTTNTAHVNINKVRHMAAFRSRRHCFLKCRLRDGVDATRLKNALPDPEYKHLLFDVLISETGEVAQEGLSYQAMLRYVSMRHKAWHAKQSRDVEEYMKKYGSMAIPKGVVVDVEKARAENEGEEDIRYLFCENIQVERDWRELIAEGLMALPEAVQHPEIGDDVVRLDVGVCLDEFEAFNAEQFVGRWRYLPQWMRRAFLRVAQFGRDIAGIVRMVASGARKLLGFFQSTLERTKEAASAFYAAHPGIVKVLSFVTGMGIVVAGGGMLYSWMRPKGEELCSEGVYETGPVKVVKNVRAEAVMAVTTIGKAQAEGTKDQTALDVVTKIKDHQVILSWAGGQVLRGLLLGGKLLLAPHHFFKGAKNGDVFRMIRPGGGAVVGISYAVEHAQRVGDKDAVIYFLGPDVANSVHLMKYFVEEKDLQRLGTLDVILAGLRSDGSPVEKHGCATGGTYIKYGGVGDSSEQYKQYGWSYEMNTQVGECGAVLVGVETSLPAPRRILGIHTAGYTNKTGGFSVLLTQEMIMLTITDLANRLKVAVISGIKLPPQVKSDEETSMGVVQSQWLRGDYSLLGVMDRDYCPSQPRKTTLRPTPYQGEVGEVKKMPSALHKTEDGTSPLWNAVSKYGSVADPFPVDDVENVGTYLSETLSGLTGSLKREVMDVNDAVFGLPGVKFCDSLNFKSSSGWPYQCDDKVGGKHHLFDVDQRKIVDERIEQAINDRIQSAKNSERVCSIWRDCLKDELRPIAKVRQGKTRLFTIPPVDFTVVCRMYFMAFVQAFYANNCTFFSAVGINAESYDWTKLYTYLRTYGGEGMAGDYSNFDGTLKAQLMYECCNIINAWYDDGEENALVRQVLFDEMIHTVQLVNNIVYMTHKGNASGNPLTVVINTICNQMYLMLAWRALAPPSLRSLHEMEGYVRSICYGDDNIVIIRRAVQPWYNQVAISKYLAQYGISYTDELKSLDVIPVRNLDDMTFLKRGFRIDPEFGRDYRLPTMDKDTIVSLTNWYRSGPDIKAQLRVNAKCALAFAFFHGREFYDEFSRKLWRAMRKEHVEPVVVLYDDWSAMFTDILAGGETVMFPEFQW